MLTQPPRIHLSEVLFVLLVVSMPVCAQSPMTLHDCMVYAVDHSTRMRLQAADRSDEQWQRRQALMQAFTPSLSAQTYANNQYGRNLDPETNTYNTVSTFYNGYGVGARMVLFDGFQAVNNLKMATISVKMGISQEQLERDQICLATMEAFANVLYYRVMEKVLIEQVATARTSRDRALRQKALGQKGHADVVQMESELAQKEYLLISTTHLKHDALLTLKDVMYWPTDQELLLDTAFSEPECLRVATTELIAQAKRFHPSAQLASYRLHYADLDLKSAKGSYSPTIGLSAGWSTTYYTYPGLSDYATPSFSSQFKNNGGEYIQLQLNLPIFDQASRRTNLHRRKNALDRAQLQLDQTLRDIENEVRRAVNDRDGAEAAFRQAERLEAVRQEAYQLSQRQYEVGLISVIDYQTASQLYLHAVAEKMNSLLKFCLKDAVVRYYNGESYINQ